MNGHQWRIKRLLAWSMPGLCLLLLILYLVGVTFSVSPKLHKLEHELNVLNLPDEWREEKSYRKDTRDLFGICENPFANVKCPNLMRKVIAPSLEADPRVYFEETLSNAGYSNIKSSLNCMPTIYTGRTLFEPGDCSTNGEKGTIRTSLSVQDEFIGKTSDIPINITIFVR